MTNRPSRIRALGSLMALAGLAACAWAEEPLFQGLPVIGDPQPSADADKFSFAILGDKTSGGEGKWPIFDRAVDSINLLRPDFVISVGDQIPGHMQERAPWDAEWAEYLGHARRLEAPLLLTVGNHDIANIECYEFWKQDFGPTYYAFDYKGCHFLVLNTEEERIDGRGPVWQAMMTFAKEDLEKHRDARHTFVFFHKPMWDDPRYEEDWARLEQALAGRAFTVVAGHEHYLMTERRDDDLYVIQSATGGGIALSDVREFGCFHSVGYITVDGESVTYAVVEPEGGTWPVDVAPASFRKAVAHELLTFDAAPPQGMDSAMVTVRAEARFHNTLAEAVTVDAVLPNLEECGWIPDLPADSPWSQGDAGLGIVQALEPGQRVIRELRFRVPRECLPYPPQFAYRVNYQGEWLQNESFSMVQENVVPIYPIDSLKAVPEWQLVGPFPLGDFETNLLPEEPAKANANFFKRFGPEDGYDPDAVYGDGLRWFSAKTQGRGLLNFNALMGTLDHALGYALCGIHADKACLTHALVYSDNYHQAVLNGELIEEGQDFGAPSGFTYVPLELKAGWNTFIVKLINNHGDWFLRVLIADPNDGLQFAPAPPQ